MNLEELREKVSRLINFSSTSPDQDFDGGSTYTYKHIDDAINEAVEDEYDEAVNECGMDPFLRRLTFTWPSATLTQKLPSGLSREQIVSILDTTGSTRGVPLWVGDRFNDATLIWRDFETLEWGTAGPGGDKTIIFEYISRPALLTEKTHRPDVIPEHFHRLLVWAAGILLRDKADEDAPRRWIRNRDEKRMRFHKWLSANSPRVTSPMLEDSFSEGAY